MLFMQAKPPTKDHNMTHCVDEHAPAAMAALNLPHHRDLSVEVSASNSWLHLNAPDGAPADYRIEWVETVTEHGETYGVQRLIVGTFDNLTEQLTAVLNYPARDDICPVELAVSRWALRYKLPAPAELVGV